MHGMAKTNNKMGWTRVLGLLPHISPTQSSSEYESEWKTKPNQVPSQARVPQEMKRSFLLQFNILLRWQRNLLWCAMWLWLGGCWSSVPVLEGKLPVHSTRLRRKWQGHEEASHVTVASVTDRYREYQSFSSDETPLIQAASMSQKKHFFKFILVGLQHRAYVHTQGSRLLKASILTLKSFHYFQQTEFHAETVLCQHIATLLMLLIKAKGLKILAKHLFISVNTSGVSHI